MNIKLLGVFIVSILGLTSLGLLHPAPAYAATFTVDSVADDSDDTPGDGNCDEGAGDCTLRAAIEETNALAGADTIEFDIDGAGVHTITPGSDLEVNDEVTIDGTTQSDSECGTLVPTDLPAENDTHTLRIEIDPADALAQGLLVRTADATSSTVRGLVIGGAVSGIQVSDDAEDVTIECNYIGTSATGSTSNQNSAAGISMWAAGSTIQNNLISASNNSFGIDSLGEEATIQNNLIGTTAEGTDDLPNDAGGISAADEDLVFHNVIAGNGGEGINMDNSATVLGNYIGVGVTGDPIGNAAGIDAFSGSDFVIGGVDADERNIISGNETHGIHIWSDCNGGSSSDGQIFNNYIGTNVDGEVQGSFGEGGFGNGEVGIEVNEFDGGCVSVYRHQIGGIEDGQPNIIAGNADQGVLIHQTNSTDVFSISVVKNLIHSNGALDIDLAEDSNDDGEADINLGQNAQNNFDLGYPAEHANNYLNAPIINSAEFNDDELTINYDFRAPDITNSDPELMEEDLVGYRLEFYANENQDFLGSFIVDGAENNAEHTFSASVDVGDEVTATATVLWDDRSDEDPCEAGMRYGTGPPYVESGGC